ncbi:MAG: 3-hydroxy-3-methylglutaryl-CoA reductase, partial [Myxococcaceae bacterium]|nr:3-hydroxy-3-methylglutaryl-CoA reductase [Myxococcaceae bacterium]
MSEQVTSRLSGFHKLSLAERRAKLAKMFRLSQEELARLDSELQLSPELANTMVENAVGTFSLPLGLGLNLAVNGRDYVVPMVVEEPSVVAAVSFANKIVREAGGFVADADDSMMIGQVQVTRYGDPAEATEKLLAHREQILALANSFHPSLVRRGGGARDIEVRVLPA